MQTNEQKRANRVFDIIQAIGENENVAWQLRSRCAEVQWHERYAGRPAKGTPNGIVSGNWNKVRCGSLGCEDATLERAADLFERLGVEVVWSDGISTCNECYGVIETQPDSFGWTPQFHVFDGSIVCAECLADCADDYLQEIEGNNRPVDVLVDLGSNGYVAMGEDLRAVADDDAHEFWWTTESDVRSIKSRLADKGVHRVIVRFERSCRMTVWVHEDEVPLTVPRKVDQPTCEPRQMTEAEYRALASDDSGICLACGELYDSDFCEPDMTGHECPECGEHAVCGAEYAMVVGAIDIIDS